MPGLEFEIGNRCCTKKKFFLGPPFLEKALSSIHALGIDEFQ